MAFSIIKGDYEILVRGDEIIINGQSYNRDETFVNIYPQSVQISSGQILYCEREEFLLPDEVEITSEATSDVDYFNDCLFSRQIAKSNIARLLQIQSENDLPFTFMLTPEFEDYVMIFELSIRGDLSRVTREDILHYNDPLDTNTESFEATAQKSIEKGRTRQMQYQNLMALTEAALQIRK